MILEIQSGTPSGSRILRRGRNFIKSLQAENVSHINKQVLDKFQIAQWMRDLNRLVEKSKTFEKTDKPKLKRKERNRRF